MAMKRCPVCGEKYSDTYKTCPFCEEEEAQKNGSQIRRGMGRSGKRAVKSRQPNLLSPILIVLIVIMVALLVYLLFGDQIAGRLSGGDSGTQDQQVEDVTPEAPDTTDPETGDEVTMPEDGGTDGAENGEDGSGSETTPETDPSTLPETLTIAYLGSPRTEFTMSVGDDPIPLTASGGNGTYTWSSSDDGVASVDADGNVTAIAQGRATLTVSDGTGRGTCVVLVRGGSTSASSSGGSTSASSGTLTAGSAEVVGSSVRVRSGPGTDYDVLASVSNGADVQIVRSAGNGWYEITFVASGGVTTTGYMLGDYLRNT